MKKLTATAIACIGLASMATAQERLTYNTTPPPFTTVFQEYGGDGSVYSIFVVGGNQLYFPLPWGLDFSAGWEVLVGKRTRDLEGVLTEVPAWGVALYGMKYIGGDGAFIRASLRGMFDSDPIGTMNRSHNQRLNMTITISIGWRTSN